MIVDTYEEMLLWRPYRASTREMQAVKLLAEEVNNGLWNREIFEAYRDKILSGLDAHLKSTHIYY